MLASPEWELSLAEGERLVVVMPVHSWGPAVIVTRFFERAKVNASEAYVVYVCGDMCGNADKRFARLLRKRGVDVVASYSVQMPNNYILMKGFGIDSEALAADKLSKAQGRVDAIANAIEARRADEALYTRGSAPWLKTEVIYPLFVRIVMSKVKFHADASLCTSCGHCAKVCPKGNITMRDGRPQWGRNCVQCVACIHRCPVRAIEFGNVTQDQGRYKHPEVEKA